MNVRRLALRAIPWLLLAAMTGFAAIGWTHFLAKDRALWQRAFAAIDEDTASLAALESGDIAVAASRLKARRDEHCAWIARYAEHAHDDMREQLAAAQASCARAAD